MTDAQPGNVRPGFVVLNTHLRGRQYVLSGRAATIGRGQECDILLDLASVSRAHARVEEVNGRFFALDLGSRNGIRLGDQRVTKAELRNGDVLTVGEVQLRFERSTVRTAHPPAQMTPGDQAISRPLTGTDVITAARSGAAPGPPGVEPSAATEEVKPHVGLNIKLLVMILLVLVISVGAGVALVRYLGTSSPTGPIGLPTKLIRVRENRWIPLRGLGRFSQGGITVQDKGIVKIRKLRDAAEIVVTGESGGTTAVTVSGERRSASFRVLVRGRLEDPLEEFTYVHFSAEERHRMAREFLEVAQVFEKEGRAYLAMQEYQKAIATLKPLEQGDLYLAAKQGVSRAKHAVAECWQVLRSEIRVAVGNNNYDRVRELCEEVLVLIPDSNDWRYQKIEAAKQELRRREMAKTRARKRGRR